MRPTAILTAVLLAALAWLSLTASASEEMTINLQAGQTAVTWSGAEPYALANFADTPVTQIHRWDAVRQRWLSHSVGQSDPTLPELHLLPRAQYLLVSDAAHVLTIPNPIESVNPLAELRFPAPPDDPLRFEAYWPNEDSPLEDLIALRPDDERLSVEAWVEGGVGEIEVYWLLDGRLNHQGPASDDVELIPGKHDDARLTAVDETGQVVVVELPRVVKLPPLDLPEMSYGIWTHINREYAFTDDELETSIRYISEAGFDLLVFGTDNWGNTGHTHPDDGRSSWVARSLERATTAVQAENFALFSHTISVPAWASQGDLSRNWRFWSVSPPVDSFQLQRLARNLAHRYPQVRYWMLSHESNLSGFYRTTDPYKDVERIRASALGIWYEQPSAVIVANGLVQDVPSTGTGSVGCGRFQGWFECWVRGADYLQALYDHGFARWVDVVAYHPNSSFERSVIQTNLIHEIMSRNGDGDTPLWATSVLIPSSDQEPGRFSADERAVEMVRTIEWMAQDMRVRSIIIYNFRENNESPTLTYGLVEDEFVNGQPVPTPTWNAVVDFLRRQRQSTAE